MSTKKPTKAELEAGIQAALVKDEELIKNPPAPSEPIPSQPVPSQPIPSEPIPSEPIPSEPIPSKPAPSAPAPEPTPSLPDVNLKKRYKESGKEANILLERNKAVNDAIQKATNLPEPTEEELTKEEPDWEIMSDQEKKVAKEMFINKRFRAYIAEATKQFVDIDAWRDEIETFVASEKNLKDYPELVGKEGLFKEYASRIQYKGTPFEVLVPAFLNGYNQSKPQPHKGEMFPSGSGGPNHKPELKSDKLTLAQGQALMKTDFQKYKKLLRDGKIADE